MHKFLKKFLKGKEGVALAELYQSVLFIVLIGFVIGVGVLGLDKFSTSSGVTTVAQTAINNARTEVGNIATNWLGLIVTIIVLSLIIFLIARSFFMGGTQGRQ